VTRAGGPLRRAWAWLHAHALLLWWLHSLWALAWGVAFMWLGSRQFTWLRVAFVYFAIIWATSLLLRLIVDGERLSPRSSSRTRLVVNYVNKNFYQQMLFFVLPIYWASASWGAPNLLFVAIVALSALLSTSDVIYDRHVSTDPDLTAIFFAFNLFVCANVALPILWSLSTLDAMRLAAVLALAGFVTLRFHPGHFARARTWVVLAAAAALLAFFIEWGRPLVPPAPLRLVSTQFGLGLSRHRLTVASPVQALEAGHDGPVFGVSAIHAPLGLKDRVRHRWTAGGHELFRSGYYEVAGGRQQGYRLWTSVRLPRGIPAGALELWVETEGGQLIGRARLPVVAARPGP
jgi:hypothetical protein